MRWVHRSGNLTGYKGATSATDWYLTVETKKIGRPYKIYSYKVIIGEWREISLLIFTNHPEMREKKSFENLFNKNQYFSW